ncbi:MULTISPECIES: hypothetical protein [Chryseobacterium]|uniref:Uncharacterized protein n=1 Tax=Chryseobacterium geocarposphaerae TaxID=1416776 RepID=A0ABU1LHK9_9FLAO|nr:MULTISPECIES: hypothetical protein [Chryseobacterium]ALR29207.1 hypothetical protein ATE47_01065 [Chryseobacterium sp. IHB B 17019]MDR6406035.1 hypothetical protein [Chryseobacterium geocarposphaerae]MDR6699520.1 hypothetical protein [Chryseobacterium ginsenosidimutans]
MKNTFFEYAILALIVLKIIITGILTTTESFCSFYKYENPFENEGNEYDKTFAAYTGFDTGYGFFAPNVASNFVIISKDLKSGNTYLSTDLLSTKEGKLRFCNLNDVYMKNITPENKNSTDVKINHILLKQVNKAFERKYNKQFQSTAYLYDHNYLTDPDKKTRLIKIDQVQ